MNIKEHIKKWQYCINCDIGIIAHRHVFYRGDIPCDVLFLGEGPGQSEDVLGEPFVGRAGRLLDLWIEDVCTLWESCSICITNIVACRPTDKLGGRNRSPNLQERHNCEGRLYEFIDIVSSEGAPIIVALGKYAADYSPDFRLPHPAYVLRNGGRGSEMDQEVRDELKRTVPQWKKRLQEKRSQ